MGFFKCACSDRVKSLEREIGEIGGSWEPGLAAKVRQLEHKLNNMQHYVFADDARRVLAHDLKYVAPDLTDEQVLKLMHQRLKEAKRG